MLLIARRIGESFQIGPDIEVKIVHASSSRVMVAIAAPRALRILRINANAAGKAPRGDPQPPEREANETIRQRRFKVASR